MAVPTIFDLCEPRADVRAGTSSEADFAADLAHVIRGAGGPVEYSDPARFFANTHPTRGLRSLLANVCTRLAGKPGAAAAIFRLDTSFGGGKTHGLIALVHAARGMRSVTGPEEFIDPALIPNGEVKVAAFDGENADPANGRRMGEDVLAFTPWGEIAYALGGRDGYARLQRSGVLTPEQLKNQPVSLTIVRNGEGSRVAEDIDIADDPLESAEQIWRRHHRVCDNIEAPRFHNA
jgi:hypothetical protein